MTITEKFTYRMTAFPSDADGGSDNGYFSSESASIGTIWFDLPFEAEEADLLGIALEQVGIYDGRDFHLETSETGGFIIRNLDGEDCYSIELEEEDDGGHYDPSDTAAFGNIDPNDEVLDYADRSVRTAA